MYSIMSSADSESFFSFPILIPFISFSSLIAMARTSKTMLNNNEKNGHPSLVPDLRESASVYHCWDVCCGFVIYGLYYIEVASFYTYFLDSFHHKLASLVAQTVKNLPAMKETWVLSLGWEDPLEKKMASSFSILAWRILWIEKPTLQSMESQRVGYDWVTNTLS